MSQLYDVTSRPLPTAPLIDIPLEAPAARDLVVQQRGTALTVAPAKTNRFSLTSLALVGSGAGTGGLVFGLLLPQSPLVAVAGLMACIGVSAWANVVERAHSSGENKSAITARHLRFALDTANSEDVRVEQAFKFGRATATVSAAQGEELLRGLPRGREWGIAKPKDRDCPHLKLIRDMELGKWTPGDWEPYDVSVVFDVLTKVEPVTDEQRASLLTNALEIVTSYYGRSGEPADYNEALQALVRELVRQLPAANVQDARAT